MFSVGKLGQKKREKRKGKQKLESRARATRHAYIVDIKARRRRRRRKKVKSQVFHARSLPLSLILSFFRVHTDAPVCKDGTTTQVVGALKHETISLVCGVQSKPPPTTFRWTFNNSGELMNVPVSSYVQVKPQHLITTHWHGSRLNYTPTSDMDYGTIACQATNAIGAQKVPCLFQIIVAGKPASLQNCSAVQSTGPYAYRMGE